MTQSGRQHTKPLFLDRLDDSGIAQALSPLPREKSGNGKPTHDEWWLQRLIFQFPQVLPVREIEPGFSALVPVCIELPTPAGNVDNLFVTGNGDLVLAECKLWRNPEARRQVVAQIIDYAQSMASWAYQDLEDAIARGALPDGEKPQTPLYTLINETEGLDEPDFTDAVSRNLRLGRILLLIVGDGVRESVEALTDYLQMHPGFHFTLSMIEMPVFRLPEKGYVVHPRVLAKTVNVERGIVSLADSRLHVEAPRQSHEGEGKRRTISHDRLMEMLEETDPEIPKALDRFLNAASEIGVETEPAGKSLQLRWRGPDDTSFNVGGISHEGKLITYNVGWPADDIGRVDLAHEYLDSVAALIGGTVRQTKKPALWYVVEEGVQEPRIMAVLSRQGEWIQAIESYGEKLAAAIKDRSE